MGQNRAPRTPPRGDAQPVCASEHLPSVPFYPVSEEPLHSWHTGHQQLLLYITVIFTHYESGT